MKAVVDAVYGQMVRILCGETESAALDVPLRDMPDGVQPGMVLQMRFHLDEAATRKRKQQQTPAPEEDKYGWRKVEFE